MFESMFIYHCVCVCPVLPWHHTLRALVTSLPLKTISTTCCCSQARVMSTPSGHFPHHHPNPWPGSILPECNIRYGESLKVAQAKWPKCITPKVSQIILHEVENSRSVIFDFYTHLATPSRLISCPLMSPKICCQGRCFALPNGRAEPVTFRACAVGLHTQNLLLCREGHKVF